MELWSGQRLSKNELCQPQRWDVFFFFNVYFCKFWGSIFYHEKKMVQFIGLAWVCEHTQNVVSWTSLMVNPSTYEGLGLLELRCGLVHDFIRPTKMSSQNLPNTHFQPWSTSGPPKNEIEYACGIYIYIFRIIYVIPFEGTTVFVTNFTRTKKPSFRREIFFVTNKNMVSLKVSSSHRNFHCLPWTSSFLQVTFANGCFLK